MTFRRTLVRCAALLVVVVVLPAAAARAGDAPELTDQAYERWRDFILPKADELGMHAIPWRPGFWEGVVEAQAKEMPILMFTMNGHPMACT